MIRDSITPIYENEVKVMLTYAKSDVSVVSYKIYDTDNKTILGNGDTAFHKVKGKKTANIKIKELSGKWKNISNGIVSETK